MPIHPRLLVLPLLLAAVIGCRQEQDGVDLNAVENVVANLPSVPRPVPSLDRAGLLAAVAQAASAAAAGTALPTDLRALDGRQFELRIRFGCRGPSADGTSNWLTWSYDAESRTIRVKARPTISAEEPLVASIGGEGFEAAEGFWIPRPWLLQPVCPATVAVKSADPQQPPSTDSAASEPGDEKEVEQAGEPAQFRQRLGIAQLFTDTDSRTGRRDSRPYQAVHTLKEGQALSSQGFNLVLSGRLRALAGGGVIECAGADADKPPDCIISAEFQRVWIEQPETGEVIADWGDG
ncbi:MAG: hypothetical protein M3438_05660 [Pseudomonadota bacterium]|nr:hypothetical protein [Sphingomonas sp.]MDQ3478629.1 hypothetical protein [Pseudomonadota bacterium]